MNDPIALLKKDHREAAKEGTIEHGLIRDGLANLATLVDEPGFHASVAMLTAGVRHHVRRA